MLLLCITNLFPEILSFGPLYVPFSSTEGPCGCLVLRNFSSFVLIATFESDFSAVVFRKFLVDNSCERLPFLGTNLRTSFMQPSDSSFLVAGTDCDSFTLIFTKPLFFLLHGCNFSFVEISKSLKPEKDFIHLASVTESDISINLRILQSFSG